MNFIEDVINNRWVVEHQLGSGAAGAVYSVADNTNEHPGAVVKFSVVEGVEEMDEDEKFELEADAEDALNNELQILDDLANRSPALRVPKVLASGIHKEFQYMVMTKFGDSVLDMHEEADMQLSNAAIVAITTQVFQTIRKLHTLGISHEDIKEANVVRGLAAQKDNFFLIDFGLSCQLATSSPANDVGDLLHMMVRLFRDGDEGLIPNGEVVDYVWHNLSDEQHRVLLGNWDKAVEARNNKATPIPDVLNVLVHEAIGQLPPNYERMNTLLQKAYAQTVDPNNNLFD